MRNTKIKIFIAIAVIVLASAAFYFAKDRMTAIPFSDFFTVDKSQKTEKADNVEISKYQIYTNPKYGFSFSHSKELNVSEFSEEGADVVLVKDATGDGFQIFITPFDELPRLRSGQAGPPAVSSSNPITKERILKDIPNMVISNDKIISVSGESALSFKSKDESGETLEIWFIRGGNLYQITVLPDFEKQISQILGTWKFQ